MMAVCQALSRALSACSWQSQMRASSPWPSCSMQLAAQDSQAVSLLESLRRHRYRTDGIILLKKEADYMHCVHKRQHNTGLFMLATRPKQTQVPCRGSILSLVL